MKRCTLLLIALFLLAGCSGQNIPPVYRIGLVAPFEGRYREIGYDVIYAARLALHDGLESAAWAGYNVELVAYDDMGDPAQARLQARALAADPQVLVVIGHWHPVTTRIVIEEYQAAGLPLITTTDIVGEPGPGVFVLSASQQDQQAAVADYLAEQPGADAETYWQPEEVVTSAARITDRAAPVQIGWTLWETQQFRLLTQNHSGTRWFVSSLAWPGELPDGAAFRVRLLASAPFVPEPGPYAALAYDATRVALEAIARANTSGHVARANMSAAIALTDLAGFSGPITFGSQGYWQDAPLYLYAWRAGDTPSLPERLR